MAKQREKLNIPAGLGISEDNGTFTLRIDEKASKAAKNILAWIVAEEYTGFDLVLLSALAYTGKTPSRDTSLTIGENPKKFHSLKYQYFDIEIANDEMRAWLNIKKPSPGIDITVDDCLFVLLANEIRAGYDVDSIASAISHGLPAFRVAAASGRQPQSGNDGEIIYHEMLDWNLPMLSTHPFHVVTVQENEILAQKLPPGPIEDGYTVTGKTIPYKPAALEFPAGENTHLSDDALTLYASVDGYVSMENGVLSVREGLRIPGDVDYNSGNISYHGKIIIEGDVRAGHHVHSDSDIEVHGCIEGANVSAGGTITVHNGINGLEKSHIVAGGDVRTDYVQDANVVAGGDVVIERYVSRSVIEAHGKISVDAKAGLIRGGVIWSEERVQANIVGSTACVPTTIKIQPNLSEDEQQQVSTIEERLHQLGNQQSQIRRRLDYLSLLEKRQRYLDANYQEEAQILAEKIVDISQEILVLQDKRETLQSVKTKSMDKEEPLIIIQKKIYPGVRFILGEHEMLVQEEVDGGKVCILNDQLFLKKVQAQIPEKNLHLYNSVTTNN